jgi:NAD(P)H dehydrogenase (quinone)
MADAATKGLASAGHEIRRINLYDMPPKTGGGCFAPLLSAEERSGYFEENAQPQLKGDPHVQLVVDSLRWCDSLVLVYPTWWFSIPAILKGFFDRCFVPGVGFRYNKELGKRETGLQNIKQATEPSFLPS